MPRACTVCAHPEREEIDHALVSGESCSTVSARFSTLGRMALQRHKEGHIPAQMAKAVEAQEVAHAGNLLDQVHSLRNKALSLLLKAEAAGDLRTALLGVREARACLELLAKLLGELNEQPQMNVLVTSDWLHVRAALFDALSLYPDARAAVAARLMRLEASNGHRQ